jgi:hypothetical protein
MPGQRRASPARVCAPYFLIQRPFLAELYPGLPLWVENAEEFVQALGGGLLPVEELDRSSAVPCLVTLPLIFEPKCSYKRHTQRNTHFSALLDACAAPLRPSFLPLISGSLLVLFSCRCRYRDSGGLDTKRGTEEHEQLLHSCGWMIRAEEAEVFRMAKDITGRQLLSSSWFRSSRAVPPASAAVLLWFWFCFGSIMVLFLIACQVRVKLRQRRVLSRGQAASVRVKLRRANCLPAREGLQLTARGICCRCEGCGELSFCACACGTPYCSRLCQRSDWKGHRS